MQPYDILINVNTKTKGYKMANLSISGISQRIFNTTKHENTVARSTNPFAASSFKGNVLTADVFESSVKNNQPAFTGKTKLMAAALVGNISNLGSRINARIESVVAFGNRMKENVVNIWNKIDSVKLEDSIKSFFEAGVINKNTIAKMQPEQMSEARMLLTGNLAKWSESLAA